MQAYSILDVWGLNRTRLEEDTSILQTITDNTVDTHSGGSLVAAALRGATTAFGSPIFRSLVLGSRAVQLDSKGKVTKAEVFRVSLFKKTNKVTVYARYHLDLVLLIRALRVKSIFVIIPRKKSEGSFMTLLKMLGRWRWLTKFLMTGMGPYCKPM